MQRELLGTLWQLVQHVQLHQQSPPCERQTGVGSGSSRDRTCLQLSGPPTSAAVHQPLQPCTSHPRRLNASCPSNNGPSGCQSSCALPLSSTAILPATCLSTRAQPGMPVCTSSLCAPRPGPQWPCHRHFGSPAQRRPVPSGGMSAAAERLVGNLFKASLLLISLPLAGFVVVDQLLLPGVVRGLRANKGTIQERALSKVPTHIVVSPLAARFVTLGGVTAVLNLFSTPQEPSMLTSLLKCLEHLTAFPITQQALIEGRVVERFETLLTSGTIPRQQVEAWYALYLDLHAARRVMGAGGDGAQETTTMKPLAHTAVVPSTDV